MKKMLKNKKGFTLVEMIVVLAIIAILIALLAPNVARLIRNAQITSDDARARSAYTTSASFATAELARQSTYTLAGDFDAVQLNNANPNTDLQAVWTTDVAGTPTPTSQELISATDGLLPMSAVAGDAELTLLLGLDGVPVGVIYSIGGRVRAVNGEPGAATNDGSAFLAGEFTTDNLRDGTLTFTTGTPNEVDIVPVP